MTTVFGDILDGNIPCEKVFENERILAFKDIKPLAPVHILIIPKRRDLASLQDITAADGVLIGEIALVARNLAEEYGVADGYRFLSNIGSDAGQEVKHLHFHLIGGKALGQMA